MWSDVCYVTNLSKSQQIILVCGCCSCIPFSGPTEYFQSPTSFSSFLNTKSVWFKLYQRFHMINSQLPPFVPGSQVSIPESYAATAKKPKSRYKGGNEITNHKIYVYLQRYKLNKLIYFSI
jgi:hypothetical protein